MCVITSFLLLVRRRRANYYSIAGFSESHLLPSSLNVQKMLHFLSLYDANRIAPLPLLSSLFRFYLNKEYGRYIYIEYINISLYLYSICRLNMYIHMVQYFKRHNTLFSFPLPLKFPLYLHPCLYLHLSPVSPSLPISLSLYIFNAPCISISPLYLNLSPAPLSPPLSPYISISLFPPLSPYISISPLPLSLRLSLPKAPARPLSLRPSLSLYLHLAPAPLSPLSLSLSLSLPVSPSLSLSLSLRLSPRPSITPR